VHYILIINLPAIFTEEKSIAIRTSVPVHHDPTPQIPSRWRLFYIGLHFQVWRVTLSLDPSTTDYIALQANKIND